MRKYKYLNEPYPVNLYLTVTYGGMKQINDKIIPQDKAIPKDLEHNIEIALALSDLTEREIDCIRLYFRDRMTYRKIGELYNVVSQRISQIISRAIRKLRHPRNLYIIFNGSYHNMDFIKGLDVSLLYRSISDIGLSNKSIELLNAKNIMTIGNLLMVDKYTIECIDCMDYGLLDEINSVLAKMGLRLYKSSDDDIDNNWNSSLKKDDPIEILDLSIRAQNALKLAKIETVGDLVSKSRYQLLSIRNLDDKSLGEIINVLRRRYNLRLRGE